MKNLKFTLLILCIFGSYVVQSQNPHWALCSSKFTLANNTISPLPGPPSANCAVNTGGLFDASGNIVFSTREGKVYNKTGVLVHTIASTLSNASTIDVKQVAIVPVPGGGCGEYYLLYAAFVYIQNSPNDYYEVGAIKVTVDNFQNIVVSSNTISTVHYLKTGITPSTRPIEIAVSKENNGQRSMYVAFQRQLNANQIEKIMVSQNGLTMSGGFLPYMNGNGYFDLHPSTLELSPDQKYLAWIESANGGTTGGYNIRVRQLATGAITDIIIPSLGPNSDLEFGPNSNDIYATTFFGKLAVTSLSNPQSHTIIANANNLKGSDIEWGSNNKLYAAGMDDKLYTIVGQTVTVAASYNGPILPKQVDGETIQYAPPTTLTIYLSLTTGGLTQANITGGSGNYTYTWYSPLGAILSTGSQARLCRRGLHTLVVRDNASGCNTTYTFENYPSPMCRSISSEIKVGKVQVKAYPNPTSDYLNIQANSTEKIVQLQVASFQGEVLMQIEGSQHSNQRIATNGLKPGMYIMNITTDKSIRQVKFTVK